MFPLTSYKTNQKQILSRTYLVIIFACLTLSSLMSCHSATSPETSHINDIVHTTHVTHIDARLDVTPDEDGAITGHVTLHGELESGENILILDAWDFQEVEVVGKPAIVSHLYSDDARTLTLRWHNTGTQTTRFNVTLDYRATPAEGLVRTSTDVWTTFHTWQWLPVESSPGQRITLNLDVVMDDSWEVTTTTLAQHVPHPAYILGFHASNRALDVRSTPHGKDTLEVKGATNPDTVLKATSRALTFWKTVFGEDWLPETYTQVFVNSRAMQEAAGMAFITARYAATLDETPEEDWLIVHELAHQEWGNLITCATWGDFWLNEGFAVWWVYRHKLLRVDTKGAQHERQLWMKRVAHALEQGHDPRIHRPDATHDNAGGSIVYNGGALLFQEIAEMVGEKTFDRVLSTMLQQARASKGMALTTEVFIEKLPLNDTQKEIIFSKLRDANTLISDVAKPEHK